MDFFTIVEWSGLFLGIWGSISGIILILHAYFWIDKFERKNGIRIDNANSWLARIKRVSAIMWLAGTISHKQFHQRLRKKCEKDFYNSQYLKLSPEILHSLQCKSWYFFTGALAFLAGCIILKFLGF